MSQSMMADRNFDPYLALTNMIKDACHPAGASKRGPNGHGQPPPDDGGFGVRRPPVTATRGGAGARLVGRKPSPPESDEEDSEEEDDPPASTPAATRRTVGSVPNLGRAGAAGGAPGRGGALVSSARPPAGSRGGAGQARKPLASVQDEEDDTEGDSEEEAPAPKGRQAATRGGKAAPGSGRR